MIHINNLTTLRDLLVEEKKVKLNMAHFHTIKNKAVETLPTTLCKSSVCLVGFAAFKGIGETEKYKIGDKFNYFLYSAENLVSSGAIRCDATIWDFLFSLKWGNSLDEALARLELVIRGDYDQIKMNRIYIDYDHKYA